MSKPLSPQPGSAGDDRNLVAVDAAYPDPAFEDRLRLFWEKNATFILIVLVAAVLAIVGKGAYELVQARREKSIAADYAAATDSTALKTFANDHPNHALGGLARLRLADEAYVAGRNDEAIAAYKDAAPVLDGTPFAARARLGAAIASLQAGKTAEAQSALQTLFNDLDAPKAIRAESAYHLATLSLDAGRPEDASKFVEQLLTIDPSGQWAQRGFQLRSRIPAPAVTEVAPAAGAAATDAPTIRFNK